MKLRFPAPTVHKEGLENAEVISDGASREIFLGEVSSELGLKEEIGGVKKDSRGLPRGAAGNPRVPRLLPGTLLYVTAEGTHQLRATQP